MAEVPERCEECRISTGLLAIKGGRWCMACPFATEEGVKYFPGPECPYIEAKKYKGLAADFDKALESFVEQVEVATHFLERHCTCGNNGGGDCEPCLLKQSLDLEIAAGQVARDHYRKATAKESPDAP